jgi:diguanylate cyclase (GGDEF)-like protein
VAGACLKDTLSDSMSFRRRLLLSVLLILIVPVVLIVVLFVALSRETRDARTDARISGALPAVIAEYREAVDAADSAVRGMGRDPDLAAAVTGPASARGLLLRRLATEHGLQWIEIRGQGIGVTRVGPGAPFAVGETRVRTPRGVLTLRGSVTGHVVFRVRATKLVLLPVATGIGPDVVASDPVLPRDILDLEEPPPQTVGVDGEPDDLRARVFELRGEAGPPTRIALAAPLGESVLAGNGALVAIFIIAFLAMAVLAAVFLLRGLDREHEGVVEQALTDALTGLANHRRFRESIAQEVERSQRYRHDLSVLLMDLDNFKGVNDTYGHPQGDEVLRRVADVLRAESRNIDMPARYGGEEFAILLPETDVVGAVEVGERIRRRLAGTNIPVDGSDEPLVMTGSIGVAGTPDCPLVPNDLIDAADKALYEAKRGGKDRVVRAGDGGQAPEPGDE